MLARLLREPARWLTGFVPETDDNNDKDKMDDTQEIPATGNPHEPTVLDVIVVKEMLSKALNLPPEIVDTIIDLAEYWPHTSTEITYTGRPPNARKDARGGRPQTENKFLLRTPPLGFVRSPYLSPEDIERSPPPQPLVKEFEPEHFRDLIASPVATLVHPCRKIVFTIESHDQGWGGTEGHGTYHHSWTWFEVGLERCNKKIQGAGVSRDGNNDSNLETNIESASGDPSTSSAAPSDIAAPRPSFGLSSLATIIPAVEKDESSDRHVFVHPILPREDCKIQCNVTVDRNTKEHRVVWSYTDHIQPTPPDSPDSPAVLELTDIGRGKATGDGEFVRNLKLGDIVTVWAKARFPGWINVVERVKVDVYWAV